MSKFFNCNKQAGLENANEPRLGGWHPSTELGCEVKTLLHSDRCMQTGKDYLGILRRDSDGETDEFLYRDPHITFIETMLWTSKRNPYLYRGKCITVTHRDDGSLHLNFKYLKLGAGFNIEGYALEVANEIRVALKGLIEKG